MRTTILALGLLPLLTATPGRSDEAPPKQITAKWVRTIKTGDQRAIRVALSPDGLRAISGGTDKAVRLWDLETGKELKKFEGHEGLVYAVAFHPKGKLALSGGDDARVLLWDLDTGKKVRGFEGHTATVYGAAFSPDGKRIASGSADKTVRVWDVETGKELKRLEGHTGLVTGVAFSPDGKTLVSAGGGDNAVRLWDLDSAKEVKKFEGHTDMVRDVAFSPTGTQVLSGGSGTDGTGRLWDIRTGKEVHRLSGIPQGVHGVAFSPDGRRALLTGGYQVQLWDLEGGKQAHTSWGNYPTHAAFLPDGERALIALYSEQTMRLVRLPKGLAPPATPIRGKKADGVELLDAVMLRNMEAIGCSAASLTVRRGRQTLFSRGYGWCDRECTVATQPGTAFGIASCDKSFTAAMIKQLALDGKLDLDASLFAVMKTKPAGKVIDPRVHDIKIRHLLVCSAGWQGEPLALALQACERTKAPTDQTLLENLMVQKLAWTPGEKSQYDNTCYAVLNQVVAEASGDGSGKSFTNYVRHSLCAQFGVKELKVRIDEPRKPGDPPHLWNALCAEDPKDYRIGFSTETMGTFQRCFWVEGAPRDNGDPNPPGHRHGSWYNSTSGMLWRKDGITIAFVFNGRGGPASLNPAGELWEVIDQLVKDKRLPPPPKPAPNLVVNGSFEQGPAIDGYTPLNPGSTAIKGWKVTRGQIDYVGAYTAARGKRCLDLNGSPGFGGVQQTFATEKGRRYRVTFAMAGAVGSTVPVKRMAVGAAGKKREFAFDTTGKKNEAMGWVEYAWEFDAVAAKTTLEFYSTMTKDPEFGPVLDDVRVIALPQKK
jgi:choice-of-anchor C domain-containing protein